MGSKKSTKRKLTRYQTDHGNSRRVRIRYLQRSERFDRTTIVTYLPDGSKLVLEIVRPNIPDSALLVAGMLGAAESGRGHRTDVGVDQLG